MKMITRWLDHSPRSITQFLKPQKHLEFLVSGILQPLDDDSSSSSSSSSSAVSPRSDHQIRESGASFYQGFCAFILGLCYLHCDESGVEDRSVGLHAIIAHRIGIDKFVDKLDRLRKSLRLCMVNSMVISHNLRSFLLFIFMNIMRVVSL